MVPNTDQDEPRTPRKVRRTTAIALCVLVAGLSYLSQEVPRRLREKRTERIFSQAAEAGRKLQEEIVTLADPRQYELIDARAARGTVLVLGRLSRDKQQLLAKTVERFRKDFPDLEFCVLVKETPTARMDRLIAQIHGDLKTVGAKHEWLSTYGDKCLSKGRWITFLPKSKATYGDGPMPAQPEQILIGYTPVVSAKEIKYPSDSWGGEALHFPSLGVRAYANVLLRGEEKAELRNRIRACILMRCEALQGELEEE